MSFDPSPHQKLDAAPAVPRGDRWVLGLAALLLVAQISPWFFSQRDAAAYFSIARHLAQGAGLSNMDSPVLWFPPGYPMLLSPLFIFRYLPFLEVSVLQCLLGIGCVWGVYRWARLQAPQAAAWIAAISVGTNAVWILYRQPMSELAFMAAMAWFLVSLQALAQARGLGRFLTCLGAAAGLAIAVCMIRSLGIALAAGGSCAAWPARLVTGFPRTGRRLPSLPGGFPCLPRRRSAPRPWQPWGASFSTTAGPRTARRRNLPELG